MPLSLSLWSEQIVAGAFNLDPVRYTIFTTPQAAELFNKKCKIAANVVIWGDFDGEEREQSFIIVDTCADDDEMKRDYRCKSALQLIHQIKFILRLIQAHTSVGLWIYVWQICLWWFAVKEMCIRWKVLRCGKFAISLQLSMVRLLSQQKARWTIIK